MKDISQCGSQYIEGRLVRTSCAYHAGGGYDYLHCAESGGHDNDDAPVQYAYKVGATVEACIPDLGYVPVVVERCEGDSYSRVVHVRLKRRGRPVRHVVRWGYVRGAVSTMLK